MRAAVVHNGKDGVVSIGLREADDEVHGYLLERKGGGVCGDLVHHRASAMCDDLVLLVSPAPGIGSGNTRWTGVSSGNRPKV